MYAMVYILFFCQNIQRFFERKFDAQIKTSKIGAVVYV